MKKKQQTTIAIFKSLSLRNLLGKIEIHNPYTYSYCMWLLFVTHSNDFSRRETNERMEPTAFLPNSMWKTSQSNNVHSSFSLYFNSHFLYLRKVYSYIYILEDWMRWFMYLQNGKRWNKWIMKIQGLKYKILHVDQLKLLWVEHFWMSIQFQYVFG